MMVIMQGYLPQPRCFFQQGNMLISHAEALICLSSSVLQRAVLAHTLFEDWQASDFGKIWLLT